MCQRLGRKEFAWVYCPDLLIVICCCYSTMRIQTGFIIVPSYSDFVESQVLN